MKKRTVIIAFLLLFGVLLLAGCTNRDSAASAPTPTPEPTEAPTPTPSPVPTSIPYDEAAAQTEASWSTLTEEAGAAAAVEALRENAAEEPDTAPVSAVTLSEEERGGDVFARSGERLYVLSDKDLITISLAGDETRILSRARIGVEWSGSAGADGVTFRGSEKTPTALYCEGDRLAVLFDSFGYDNANGQVSYYEYTEIGFFDVSGEVPELLALMGLDGTPVTGEIHDGVFYLVTEYLDYSEDGSGVLPSVYAGSRIESTPLTPDRIIYTPEGASPAFSVIGAYDIGGVPRRLDVMAVLGPENGPVIADGKIIFTVPRTAEVTSRAFAGYTENARIACTDIFRIELDPGTEKLTLACTGTVNGRVPDAGCISLRGDELMCLTALDQHLYPVTGADSEYAVTEDASGTALYILDGDLRRTGKVESLSNGDSIDWAGFLGDAAVLTSAETGKSCLADLTDPAGPQVGPVLDSCVLARSFHDWEGAGYTAFRQVAAVPEQGR